MVDSARGQCSVDGEPRIGRFAEIGCLVHSLMIGEPRYAGRGERSIAERGNAKSTDVTTPWVKLMRGCLDAISDLGTRGARRPGSCTRDCGECATAEVKRVQSGVAPGSCGAWAEFAGGTKGAYRGAGFAGWVSLGLRKARWSDAFAGAGQA